MSRLLDKTELRKLYNMGALARVQTICDFDIGGAPNIPVEVTITDSERQAKGAFWTCDIDELLHEAMENGDTPKSNPNLPVLKSIFKEMIAVRKALGQPDYQPKAALMPSHISALLGLDQN